LFLLAVVTFPLSAFLPFPFENNKWQRERKREEEEEEEGEEEEEEVEEERLRTLMEWMRAIALSGGLYLCAMLPGQGKTLAKASRCMLAGLQIEAFYRDANRAHANEGHGKKGYISGESYIFVNMNQESLLGSIGLPVCFGEMEELPFYLVNARFAYLAPLLGWERGARGVVIWKHWKASRKRGLQECVDRVRGGESLYMSIEGTRTRDGQPAPYRNGAAIISILTQRPIVPIIFRNSYQYMPFGSWRVRGPGQIFYDFLPAVSPAGYSLEDKEALTAHLRSIAEDALDPTNNNNNPALHLQSGTTPYTRLA